MKRFVMIAAAFAALVSLGVTADSIQDRLKPAGDLCMAGDDCAAAPQQAAAASDGPRSGQQVYEAACASCHNNGIAQSPKFADVAAWEPRIAKGIETLHSNAIGGIGGMPAMGACGNCSEDDIIVAVDYMVESAQ